MKQKELDEVRRTVTEMEESVIVTKSLADWNKNGTSSKAAMIIGE